MPFSAAYWIMEMALTGTVTFKDLVTRVAAICASYKQFKIILKDFMKQAIHYKAIP
jgi:hypothetical protein